MHYYARSSVRPAYTCWTTYRRRGLPAAGLHPIDVVGKVALHRREAEPIDVILRVSRGGDVARARTDDERVGVARLARGREVPLRAEARAGDGIRDEVVLAEHARVALILGDYVEDGDAVGLRLPVCECLVRVAVEVAL